MSLLAPWFLLALGALAVPLLIHLVRRIRRAPTRFPSLMFLRRFPQREKQRLRLRDPWLLLLRCLALVLLALAFSRPYWQTASDASTATADGVAVLIVLDRSASMQAGERWSQALQAVQEIVEGLQPADRVALLSFSDQVDLISPFGSERDTLQATLAALRPTGGATAYSLALAQAERILRAEPQLPGQVRRIVLISDLQATGLNDLHPPRLAADIELQIHSVGSNDKANIGLMGAVVRARSEGERSSLDITAQIRNFGSAALSLRIALTIDDKPRDAQQIDLAGGASTSVSFRDLPAPAVATSAVLALQELDPAQNSLSSDDNLGLTLLPPPQLKLLLISNADSRQTIYLERALGILRQPAVELISQRLEQLDPALLEQVDAVIINDTPVPGGLFGQALQRFVQSGGGILVAVGADSRGEWPGGTEAAWLPGRLGSVGRSSLPASMLATAFNHPVFENASDALAAARILSYRQLEPTRFDQVLARLDNGRPALLERAVDAGRALALAVPLDKQWSDLPLQPGFVLWLKNTVNYLAAYRPLPALYTVADVIDVAHLSRAWGETHSDWRATVRTPDDRVLQLSAEQPWLQPANAGLYRILAEGREVWPLAVAIPPSESDLSRLDETEFLARIERPTPLTATAANDPNRRIGLEQAQQQFWWWYLLAAMLLLLLLEMLISAKRRA